MTIGVSHQLLRLVVEGGQADVRVEPPDLPRGWWLVYVWAGEWCRIGECLRRPTRDQLRRMITEWERRVA